MAQLWLRWWLVARYFCSFFELRTARVYSTTAEWLELFDRSRPWCRMEGLNIAAEWENVDRHNSY